MPKGQGYTRHDKMRPGYRTDSYRDSSPMTRPGANRHGFTKNPKQSSPGRMTSNPFPTNRDSVGAQGVPGDGGLPGRGRRHGSY